MLEGFAGQSPWEGGAALLLHSAAAQLHVYVLVLFRLSGMMTTAPAFSNLAVPLNVRAALLIGLSALVTPLVGAISERGFRELDRDGNGRLSANEIPAELRPRFPDGVPVTLEEFRRIPGIPRTVFELAGELLAELAIGLILGLGVSVLVSAVQVAGQLIDQQTGIGLGEALNPDLDPNGSSTGQLMMLLAVALLFLMNAHVAFVQTISETFAALPPGGALLAASSIELLSSLIAESLRLALQVAAPVLAALSIAEVALGFLGQTVPQINVLILGFPIRVLLGLIVFALIQPAAMDLLLARLPEALSALGTALSGLGGD